MASSQDPLIQAGTQAGNQILNNNQNNSGSSFSFMDGGKVDSSGVYTPPTNIPSPTTAITPDILTPQTPVTVPSYQPSPTPQPVNFTDQLLKQIQVPDTSTQQLGDNLSTAIYNLLPKLQGEQSDLAQAQIASGAEQYKKDLQSINSQILMKQAEINQDDISLIAANRDLEHQPGMLTSIVNDQKSKLAMDAAIIRGLKTAEIGVLNARAIAKQGDIQLALDTAKSAVDAKYAPIKEAISIYQQQLQAIQPILTRDEQKQAKEQELKTQLALQDLEDKKQKAKDNLSLVLQSGLSNKYINKNGEFIRTTDGYTFGTPEEFFKDAGVSSFEEAYQRGLVGDLSPQLIADRDFVLKLRETYPDAGINFNDDAQTAVTKLGASNKYTKENYMAPEDNNPKPITLKGADGQEHSYFYDNSTRQLVPAEDFVFGNPATGNGQSDYQIQTNQRIISSVDSLMNQINGKTAGILGQQFAKIPGTAAYNLKAQLETLKSNIAFGALTAMREASKTGGALGQISDREEVLLSSTLGALDLGQSPEVLKQQLQKIKDSVNRWNAAANAQGFKSAGNASASTSLLQSGKNLVAKVTSIFKDGGTGGQCGDYVRKVASTFGLTYPAVGDTLKEKIAAVQEHGTSLANARPGSVIITKENPTYGHVAMIVGRTPQGYIVTESNFKQSNKISTGRIIPYNSSKIIGVINPTPKA